MKDARVYSIEALRELLDGTTPGPWEFDGEFGHVRRVGARGTIVCTLDHESVRDPDREDGVLVDGVLLAAAPDLGATALQFWNDLCAEQGEASYQAERAERAEARADAAEAEVARLRAQLSAFSGERLWSIIPGKAAPLIVTTDRICPSDPCWIARRGNDTAIGETEYEAVERLAGRLGCQHASLRPAVGPVEGPKAWPLAVVYTAAEARALLDAPVHELLMASRNLAMTVGICERERDWIGAHLKRRLAKATARATAAEALADEAMSTGLAECERLRKVLARWQEALLCHAPECSECYRPATWERLAKEDEEGAHDDGVIADLRCDLHKPADGEWVERAFAGELCALARFAEARVERMQVTAMQVFEQVRAKHDAGKDGAQ